MSKADIPLTSGQNWCSKIFVISMGLNEWRKISIQTTFLIQRSVQWNITLYWPILAHELTERYDKHSRHSKLQLSLHTASVPLHPSAFVYFAARTPWMLSWRGTILLTWSERMKYSKLAFRSVNITLASFDM